MKTIALTILLFSSFNGSAQYDRSPQLGVFVNPGLRDFTFNYGKMKTRFGLETGINVKHSTRNGVLRLVYAAGLTYDYYKREDRDDVNRYTESKNKFQGIIVLFRPEFRIVNRERFSMYAGVGPKFCSFYSSREKRTVTENGVTTEEGWQKKGAYELSYFGIHAAMSVDYKFSEHWALNLGLNAFTSFEFEFFDGDIYSGGNVITGIAYVF